MTLIVPKDPETLGELGRALQDDLDGKVFAEYRDYFQTALFQARKKLNLPLPPEKQMMNQAMVDATTTAVAVITAIWEEMHSR